MIFATPDFGASGAVALFVLIVGAVVFLSAAAGFIWGLRLLWKTSTKAKAWGLFLMLVCGMIPLCCCILPPYAIRILYGNYPIGRYPNNEIKEGMTADEVTALLGSPHEQYRRADGEAWYYWIDSFGISYFGVIFDANGRVTHTHGN